MISASIQITPRYAETDQFGFVSARSYLPWLEIGRAALLKEHGLDYRQFEADGYLMPVLEFGLTFHRPAQYEEPVRVITTLSDRPRSFRIRLDYEIWQKQSLLANGHTVQAFINHRQRPVKPPPSFMAGLDRIFSPDTFLARQNSTAGP